VIKYGMVIDVNKCTGCYNCFLACRDEYAENDYLPYSAGQPLHGQYWMNVGERERGSYPKVKVSYVPVPCLHCEEPSCLKAATGGAVYRRSDGIVLIDSEKASGQKEIVNACPYRVIYWNEEKNIPQKCTFCAHLLDEGWKEPRCVEACPTGALIFGDLEDLKSDVNSIANLEETEELHPEYNLSPRVVYIGLPKRFIAGEVILKDRQDRCAEDVHVTLTGEDEIRTTKTDNYGDFEFEGLKPNGRYRVVVKKTGYVDREIDVTLKRDVNLCEVVLDPAL
jgi:Fe-S-cluster-containing dehydrogenase component